MNGRAEVPVLGVGAAIVAVICCAGLPAIAAVLGGITLAAVLGVAGGVLAVVAIATGAVLLIGGRRKRGSGNTSRRRSVR
jgi:hypothetical protein